MLEKQSKTGLYLFRRVYLAFLFFIGIAHWLVFFYLAHPLGDESGFIDNLPAAETLFESRDFNVHDWHLSFQFQKVVRDALKTKTLPFHVPNLGKIYGPVSERFIGAPNWSLSPQILLHYILGPVKFVVFDLLLMYSVGFYGCILLKRHYRLSLIPFTFLFLLFNFNGYFAAKYSAYGIFQLGYFFLPFLLFFLLRAGEQEFFDGKKQINLGVLAGIALSGILYQGSLHYFVKASTLIVVWGVVNYKLWRVAAVSLITAFSTAAVRILPAVVTVGLGTNPSLANWWGYFNPWKLLKAFAVTCSQMTPPKFAWWEFDVYIGWIGLFAVLFFGLWGNFKKKEWARFKGWKAMAIPCLVFAVISCWHFKRYIIPNFIPLLNKESVPSRYMIFPLLITIIIAAVNMEGFISKFKRKRGVKYSLSAILAVMAAFLFNHSRVWRMHRVQNEFDWAVAQGLTKRTQPVIFYIKNNMSDSLYIFSFWAGLVISITAIFWVIFFIARNRKSIYNSLNQRVKV